MWYCICGAIALEGPRCISNTRDQSAAGYTKQSQLVAADRDLSRRGSATEFAEFCRHSLLDHSEGAHPNEIG